MAPFTLFANFYDKTNIGMKQSGKMIAVPIPVDKRQSIMSTLIDSNKESSIVTIVRGNNYNKPIYKVLFDLMLLKMHLIS